MKTKYAKQTLLVVSPEAWGALQEQVTILGYRGTASYHGTTGYLAALIAANPLPTHWRDTRPPELTAFDLSRLERGLMPLWVPPDNGGFRNGVLHAFNTQTLSTFRHLLDAIAIHFVIWPRAHGHMINSRVAATIEAIALSYLTPATPCPPCERPASPLHPNRGKQRSVKFELAY